jgi:nucleoid DNA-binding protein
MTAEDITSKVSKRLKKKGVGHVEEKDLEKIIESVYAVIRAAITADSRTDGDFFEIPGVCKVIIKEKPARLRRNPRKNVYVAKGAVRSVKINLVKDLKDKLEAETRQAPPKAIKDQEEEQNAALAAKDSASSKKEKKGKKAKKGADSEE